MPPCAIEAGFESASCGGTLVKHFTRDPMSEGSNTPAAKQTIFEAFKCIRT